MKKLILSFLSLLAILSSMFAQNGTIAGKVIEADSGFEVIGGKYIQGTSIRFALQ